ncbi:Uma2 family endonuclease [candidate division KSB1 bacterium]|nr:Uma2 family endonuclease [candidate division KSB1 bacterium]
MQQLEKKYYTPEEYLELEETAEYKSEYYQGEIFAMSGATANHNFISGNLLTGLNNAQKTHKCFSFTNDMRLWINAKNLFTYPDFMIVCGKLEYYTNRKDTITNPLIIIEVLSDSTKNYDRGEKFVFYRSIPTFQEYIIIDQYSVYIEHFFIETKKQWLLIEYNDINSILKFSKIDFQIPLKDVYNLIEFDNAKRREHGA